MQRSPSIIIAVAAIGLSALSGANRVEASVATSASIDHFDTHTIAADVIAKQVAKVERFGQTDKKQGAIFQHIMVDPGRPGEIIPCVRILRKLLQKAEHHDNLMLEFRVTYLSNGRTIDKFFVVKVSDLQMTDHHAQPKNKKWVLADTHVEVDAPADSSDGEYADDATGTVDVIENGVTIQRFMIGS